VLIYWCFCECDFVCPFGFSVALGVWVVVDFYFLKEKMNIDLEFSVGVYGICFGCIWCFWWGAEWCGQLLCWVFLEFEVGLLLWFGGLDDRI
jgi:hypothetical protein